MFVRVYIAESVERHRGIALKTGGTGWLVCAPFTASFPREKLGREKKRLTVMTPFLSLAAQKAVNGRVRKKSYVSDKKRQA